MAKHDGKRVGSRAARSGQDVPLTSFSDYVALVKAGPERAAKRDVIRLAWMLVVFVCVAMLATNTWLIVDARFRAIEQASLANTNLARAVTEQIQGTLSEANHILNGLVYELERADVTPERLVRLQPVLVNHVAGVEPLEALFVYDAQGRWIASSEPTWDPAVVNADQAYFIHHQKNPSTQVLVGVPIVSRSSGEWIVPVSRRFDDAEGNFAGVVLAGLSFKHLRSLLDRFDIGRDGAISLIVSGRLMARRPFRVADVGIPTPPSPLKEIFDAQSSGTADARSPIDGVWRIISFEHTRNYPVLVAVAASKDEVLRTWWVVSVLQTLWVLFLCTVLGLAGFYVKGSIRHRLKAEAGLRETRDALADVSARLAHLAQYDELTGLPNRRYFDRRLARGFRQCQREQRPMAVVMVDVDEFKKYNDFYGHVEGDRCLQRVATALLAAVKRPEDLVARYGGEEMALLLPQTDASGAAQVAEALRAAVVALDIPHAKSALGTVSISLGVAAWVPQPADVAERMLKAADAALYDAKRHGRNRVNVHP